ncbi:hypothetical protein RESH_04543 [Rhodopirellula europaea SH398]|uniref:Uncharacterized protein n=1 Tax=Rhodopirellula europaea SH398 TaxID=1263868 RepID=M5SFP0_9BACT|nr:hypothetical protein RESH_04543 [Rhodopirellula europaea SH398]
MEAFVGRTVCSDAILIRFAQTSNVALSPHWLTPRINLLSRIESGAAT